MQAQPKRYVTQNVDDFLNHRTRAGGGAYLSSWKKDGSGSIDVWLHCELFSAPCWNHPVPHLVELERDGEKELVPIAQRWVCHESEELLKRQFFYEKGGERDGEREMPPVLCPMDMVIEEVRRLYRSGKIGWTDPVFEWRGTRESLVVLAGGIDGSFGSKDLSREQLRALRVADVKRNGPDGAYKQNLRAKLNYLFCLVDANDVEAGLQKAFEAKALGEKLKKAIRDEIKRARSRQDPEGRQGNPTVNPYPIEWTYDDSKDFDEKYDVLCKTREQPTERILQLIRGPAPNVDHDLEPGNCFSLRVELEEHCVLKKGLLDFDRCFEAAAKAGLMVPPEESRSDREEEPWDEERKGGDRGRPHEVRGAEPSAPVNPDRAPSVTIAASSPAWTDPKWRPGSNVRGADVVLDVPDGVSDATFDAVRKACREAGAASVAEAVMCNHCRETMTTLDPDCPSCGARYDDEGKLLSRPCLAEGCGSQVALEGDGPRYICGKCATMHEGADAAEWKAIPREQPPAAEKEDPPRRSRSRGEVRAEAEDSRKRGVPFDQPAAKGARR
jgi:hypothetical protein